MKRVFKLSLIISVLICALLVFAACSSSSDGSNGSAENNHTHSFGEWVITKAATCTEAGEQERTCSCGEKQTQSIAATGHTFGDWVITKAATCTEAGEQERTCSCGEKETQSIVATGHTFGDWVITKAATCTEAGEQERTCSCGEKETQAINSTGHTVVQDPAEAATCTAEGKTEGSHCSTCGEVFKAQETVPATGHSVVKDAAVAATCTEAGKTEGSHCSVCKEVITAQKTTNALGHSIGKNGVCTRCGYVDKTSTAYKEEQLRKRADNSAFSCAETAVRSQLKNPDSMVVLSETIKEKDDYLRYYVYIQYKATNGFGGYVTDNAYILIRINPKLDGTFSWTYNKTLGMKYIVLDSDKTNFGWGTKPDDWSVDAIVDISEAKSVSLKLILADPNKYKGQFVKIEEKLVLSYLNISRKSFDTYMSSGNGKYDYDTNRSIEVFFQDCSNYEECIMIDVNYQKIVVYGYVRIYNNSTSPYLDALEIVFE